MSLFLLPKAFCLNIEAMLRKFWWGCPLEKNHNLMLLSWKKICSPKSCGGLGIRPLESQNRSLLAKLAWNILSNKNLLWVSSLKSKYLQKFDLLNSPLPSSASWLWKGILKCRDLVEKGAWWSIASGTSIDIWNSPWIPSINGFKPTPNPLLFQLPNLSVANLISPHLRCWNLPLLNSLFDPHTTSKILGIHLPINPSLDKMIWTPSPTGVFTVKSAFELDFPSPLLLPSPLPPTDWNSLWNLKIQHRLKHFLWRITWDILPLRTNIFKFSPLASPETLSCPLCNGPAESIHHIFLACPFARAIWRNTPWPLNTSFFESFPISHWTSALLNPNKFFGIPLNSVHAFQTYALVSMDLIWQARNNYVHKGTQPNPQDTLKLLSLTVKHHSSAWQSRSGSLQDWTPPPQGSLKANFDVAIKPLFAVAAAILRDHQGNIISACSRRLPAMEANQGEAHAALLAVQLASQHGSSPLILEGDSLSTILAINSPHISSDWSAAHVIADALQLLSSLPVWTALKVSRCANSFAHHTAKWAASNLVFGSIPNSSPIFSSIRFRSGKDPPL
ncbi:hypothetical protein SLA2020_262140 [Shorea laevis]